MTLLNLLVLFYIILRQIKLRSCYRSMCNTVRWRHHAEKCLEF